MNRLSDIIELPNPYKSTEWSVIIFNSLYPNLKVELFMKSGRSVNSVQWVCGIPSDVSEHDQHCVVDGEIIVNGKSLRYDEQSFLFSSFIVHEFVKEENRLSVTKNDDNYPYTPTVNECVHWIGYVRFYIEPRRFIVAFEVFDDLFQASEYMKTLHVLNQNKIIK